MNTFATRVSIAITESGRTSQQIADMAGTSKGQVSQWRTEGKIQPEQVKADVLERISRTLQVRPRWLLYGELPMREGQSFENTIPAVAETEMPKGYVRFPLLEGFVSAGGGGYVADYPEVVQYIDVAEDWAERNIRAPRSAVRVITARGDSMTGDISDGDVLFVDSRVQAFDTDSIYVMNWQGRPLVKRLQLRRDGSVVIRSTNPAYEPEIVPPGEVDQLYVSGRVLAAWAFKKF